MAAKHPGHFLRKSERQLHSASWKTLSDADDWGGSDIFHAWNVTGSHGKLIIGNPMVSGSDVNKDLTFKAKDKDQTPKDKDQTFKAKDQDKDQTFKAKDQDKD